MPNMEKTNNTEGWRGFELPRILINCTGGSTKQQNYFGNLAVDYTSTL